jgi:hypothetical protein
LESYLNNDDDDDDDDDYDDASKHTSVKVQNLYHAKGKMRNSPYDLSRIPGRDVEVHLYSFFNLGFKWGRFTCGKENQ